MLRLYPAYTDSETALILANVDFALLVIRAREGNAYAQLLALVHRVDAGQVEVVGQVERLHEEGRAELVVGFVAVFPKHGELLVIEHHAKTVGGHGGHGHAQNHTFRALVDPDLGLGYATANGVEQVELRSNVVNEFRADKFHSKELVLEQLRACYDK